MYLVRISAASWLLRISTTFTIDAILFSVVWRTHTVFLESQLCVHFAKRIQEQNDFWEFLTVTRLGVKNSTLFLRNSAVCAFYIMNLGADWLLRISDSDTTWYGGVWRTHGVCVEVDIRKSQLASKITMYLFFCGLWNLWCFYSTHNSSKVLVWGGYD